MFAHNSTKKSRRNVKIGMTVYPRDVNKARSFKAKAKSLKAKARSLKAKARDQG